MGQYDKALEYIDKAFEHIDEKNMDFYFVYFQTYIEIKTCMGEPEDIIDRFFGLMSNIKDFFVVRQYIIDGVNNIAIASCENIKMLDILGKSVVKLIRDTAQVGSEYRMELNKCLKKIEYYKNEINKGGTLI